MSPSTSPAAGARRGNLIALSAPSGTGKTTIAQRLVDRVPGLVSSVSFTTRPRRSGERDGRDYHFVTREAFLQMAEEGRLLEWAEIYGHLYGTGRLESDRVLASGQDLLLVIDVQGARWVRRREPEAILVFLMPPGYEALLRRLERRGTESSGTLAQRLAVAREEIRAWTEYDFLVINDDLEAAGASAEAIVRAARQSRARMAVVAEAVVASFPQPGTAGIPPVE